MVVFQFSYLLTCTTEPACQPEALGQGMAIRGGSARREIRKLKYFSLSELKSNSCYISKNRMKKRISENTIAFKTLIVSKPNFNLVA